MKKIFVFIIGLVVFSCTPKITDGVEKGDYMFNAMNGKYSYAQFDSMCVADTLPSDLTMWKSIGFVDYETNAKNKLFLYMKSNGRNETMYKVEDTSDDSIKIIKRLITD